MQHPAHFEGLASALQVGRFVHARWRGPGTRGAHAVRGDDHGVAISRVHARCRVRSDGRGVVLPVLLSDSDQRIGARERLDAPGRAGVAGRERPAVGPQVACGCARELAVDGERVARTTRLVRAPHERPASRRGNRHVVRPHRDRSDHHVVLLHARGLGDRERVRPAGRRGTQREDMGRTRIGRRPGYGCRLCRDGPLRCLQHSARCDCSC